MVDAPAEDLSLLDRDVAHGWRALAEWRATLRQDLDTQSDEQPLEAVRHVAGKSTWDALGELAPAEAEAPLRDALRRWVFYLTQARIGLPLEVASVRASFDRRGEFLGDVVRQVSWFEAWRGVVSASTTEETELWLEAAATLAPAVAEVGRLRAERRLEVARRLGIDHPWAPVARLDRNALRSAAEALLDKTDDLSTMVWNRALSAGRRPAAVIHSAVARDAGEGWPAHVTSHWLGDIFADGPRGLRLDLPPLPAAIGASSFARALVAFGFAAHIAATPSSMPFALAHDPAFVSAHRLGLVFGALAVDARWQEHTLRIGRRTAMAQSVILARAALLEARLQAARLLLGDDAAFAPRDRFDELGVRLFGRQLDPRLRGAWPAAREDEPGRFVALLGTLPFADSLRERFDVDWYRNPRAWAHLREFQAARVTDPVDASGLTRHAEALASAFERVLG
jgi:hypothetical protein